MIFWHFGHKYSVSHLQFTMFSGIGSIADSVGSINNKLCGALMIEDYPWNFRISSFDEDQKAHFTRG